MENCNIILTQKQQKGSALSSGRFDKYEYLIGAYMLPFNQSLIIE